MVDTTLNRCNVLPERLRKLTMQDYCVAIALTRVKGRPPTSKNQGEPGSATCLCRDPEAIVFRRSLSHPHIQNAETCAATAQRFLSAQSASLRCTTSTQTSSDTGAQGSTARRARYRAAIHADTEGQAAQNPAVRGLAVHDLARIADADESPIASVSFMRNF